MTMHHQTVTPRETDTASVFLGAAVETYLLTPIVYYLLRTFLFMIISPFAQE
jgi:hypothetical protein